LLLLYLLHENAGEFLYVGLLFWGLLFLPERVQDSAALFQGEGNGDGVHCCSFRYLAYPREAAKDIVPAYSRVLQ
jgi:hypothetical protein